MRITLIRCSAVSPAARLIMPAPAAIPTAAVTQMLAAVVSPTTMLRRVKITPAPRNPIPLTICAAIREGSRRTSSPRTALKPNADTNVKTAEPHPTRTWVRNPALFCLNWRSIPTNEHNTNATNHRPSSVSELEVHRLTRCTFFVSYARGPPGGSAGPMRSGLLRRATFRGLEIAADQYGMRAQRAHWVLAGTFMTEGPCRRRLRSEERR